MDRSQLNYSGLARLEWLQLFMLSFPTIFVAPFIGYSALGPFGAVIFLVESAKPAVVVAGLFLLFGLVMSSVIDRWRIWASRVTGDYLPLDLERNLEKTIIEIYGSPARFKVERFKWNPSDLLMGAHVRGVLRPVVVISGGLAIGLLRRDSRAVAILSHELAHIEHYDRFLPVIAGMAVFELVAAPSLLLSSQSQALGGAWSSLGAAGGLFLYRILLSGGLLWFMSRSREFYADACAVQFTHPSEAYISLLEQAKGAEKEKISLFHPSLSKRVEEARKGFPSLRTRWPWRFYIAAATAVSWFQWHSASDDIDPLYYYSAWWVGVIILLIELLRTNLLTSPFSFRIVLPGRRTYRFAFLLLGMVFAVYVAVESENETAGAIVGGVVFALFTASKGPRRSDRKT